MPLRPTRAACAVSMLLPLTLGVMVRARTADEPAGPPYPPADSMKTMAVEQGFRVELVAAEPDMRAPSPWTSTNRDASSSSRCPVIRSTRPTGRIAARRH